MLPGGVSRHVVLLANGLNRRGLQVCVAATSGEFQKYLSSGIEFIPLNLLKDNSYAKNIFGFPISYFLLNKFIKNKGIDIIHTHKRYSDMLGRMLALSNMRFHISTCHSMFKSNKPFSIFGQHTIAISKSIESILVQNYHKSISEITAIYNGIEPFEYYSESKLSEVRSNYGISKDDKVIVCIAQFLESKDHFTLLSALEIVRNHKISDSFQCILIGHGPLYKQLSNYVNTHQLGSMVKFLSGTTNIEEIINVADFCVLSSIRDGGVPYVILEGASLRKPFVATNVGGIPEFVSNHKNGLLVPPKDPAAMAEAIEYMLNNPEEIKKMGSNAMEQYQQNHSYDTFIDRTISVYKMQLSRNKYH